MRVGVLLMPTDPWESTVERARTLEDLGFDHLWVYDHLTWRRYRTRPWFSAIPWLTGLAMATTRIRLGPMVANPNIRHPLTLAKEAITLDHISNGRLTLGVGAGGIGFDATVLGEERLSPSQRVDRLEEFLHLLDGLLTGTTHSHNGTYYTVDEALVEPRCLQQPRSPIAVAAGGRTSIALAARYGDAWVTWGDTSLQDLTEEGTRRTVAAQMAALEAACESVSRPISDLDRMFLIGNTEAQPLESVDAFADFATTYSELGFTDLVFHDPRADDETWRGDNAIVAGIAELLPELKDLEAG